MDTFGSSVKFSVEVEAEPLSYKQAVPEAGHLLPFSHPNNLSELTGDSDPWSSWKE